MLCHYKGFVVENIGSFPTKKVGIQNLLTTKVILQKILEGPTKKVGTKCFVITKVLLQKSRGLSQQKGRD